MKRLLLLFLCSLVGISYALNFDEWTDEDLCRWTDSISIPPAISYEIDSRQLSCYVSCYNGELTAEVPSCNINNDNTSTLPIFTITFDNVEKISTNQQFEGLDMSGFNPPQVGSMDSRIYYINGKMYTGGSTYISALRSYLESTGQGYAFSLSPPEPQSLIPVKFKFEITL
jgi:hypothetical protein